MNNIMESDAWGDMWKMMDAMFQYPSKEKTVATNGLKAIIRRPHNIKNVKDADGNVVAQKLEVVTTPFDKSDVKVTVNNNVLTISCGETAEEHSTSNEEYIYQGISSQSYTFSVRLNDKIDKDKIKAKNVDGVLTVTLPFIQWEKLEEKPTEIEVE